MSEASMVYPVVEERRLAAVPAAGVLARRRRDLATLPASAPGNALVFQAAGRFIVYDELRHLTGREEFVLGALTVAVVNVRPYDFHADIELPSAHYSEAFAIRVSFTAVVTDPGEVVRIGPVDLPAKLAEHLRKDPKLAAVCAAYAIERLAEARVEIDARIQSHYGFRPYELPGLRIALGLVDVLTPIELAQRDRRLRDATITNHLDMEIAELERRRKRQQLMNEHELAAMSADFENTRTSQQTRWQYREDVLGEQRKAELAELEQRMLADRAKFVLDQVKLELPGQLSMAVARGEMSTSDMIRILQESERLTVEQLKLLLGQALNGSDGDFFVMDAEAIFATLIRKLHGPMALAVGAGEGAQTAGGTNRAAVIGPSAVTDDGLPPDEDDFHA